MRQITLALVTIAVTSATGCGNETTAPEEQTVLEAVTPPPGASGVSPSGEVTVSFSGPMAEGMEQYMDLHEGDISGPVVPMSCGLSPDHRAMTCVPDQPLRPRTRYTLHIGAGMLDGSGRPVETETHGMGLGGEPVTGQMMGDMHGGQPRGMMAPGWEHPGDGHLGMAFGFETA
jgi:hypothetical protein